MSDLIDTSLIVRYLTGEPPHLADLSARLIDERFPGDGITRHRLTQGTGQ